MQAGEFRQGVAVEYVYMALYTVAKSGSLNVAEASVWQKGDRVQYLPCLQYMHALHYKHSYKISITKQTYSWYIELHLCALVDIRTPTTKCFLLLYAYVQSNILIMFVLDFCQIQEKLERAKRSDPGSQTTLEIPRL